MIRSYTVTTAIQSLQQYSAIQYIAAIQSLQQYSAVQYIAAIQCHCSNTVPLQYMYTGSVYLSTMTSYTAIIDA